MIGESIPSIHASAVMVGARAILIRGPSGSGKSQLAFNLIVAGGAGQIPGTTLIGDDRVHLARNHNEIVVRPAAALAGLIEIRGLGIRRCDFVGEAPVGLVVDLEAPDAARLPPEAALQTLIHGVMIPRVPVGRGYQPLPLVFGALLTNSSATNSSTFA